MARVRISIKGLLIVVGLFGLEFAALRSGSQLWYSAIYTATVAVLLFAVVAAKYRRGDARAFWFGVAVFGWGYLLLALGPWSKSGSIDSPNASYGNNDLLTTRLITSSRHLISGNAPEDDDAGFGGKTDVIVDFVKRTTGIAHLMVTLTLALVGGFLAVALRGRRARPEKGGAGSSGPGPPVSKPVELPPIALTVLVSFLLIGSAAYDFARPSGPYFPELAFHPQKERNEFSVEWYSMQLEGMREPSLWKLSRANPGATVYRFLWLPSFDHPASVRVVKAGSAATLHLVVLDGTGGEGPGRIAIERTVKVTRDQWDGLEARLARIQFWGLPTKLEEDSGSDGDQTILEGIKKGKYHIVDRWEPEPEYLEVCRYLIDLSGSRWLKKAVNEYHDDPTPVEPPKASGLNSGSGFR